jgi:ferric enterobactin receptor
MRTVYTVLLIVLLFSLTSFSQVTMSKGAKATSGFVTCVVVDSLTKAPIEFASFQLILKNDTSKVLGATSDKAGRFMVKNVPFDSYSARISSVGYKKRKRNLIILTEKVRTIDLDTIYLAQKSIYVGEVQVTEKKEGIIREKEKMIVRVNRDLGDNGIEILENTPMVNVDIDGNVSLVGRQNTKIYIDGISLEDYGFQKTEDLRMLSVSEIDKIEIITNPSIEFYEARDAGVINIVTKKKIENKYSGNISVGDNTRNNFYSTAYFNYNFKKLMLRGNYDYGNSQTDGGSSFLKTISINDSLGSLQQSNDYENSAINNRGTITLYYNPDKHINILSSLNIANLMTGNVQTILNNQNINGNNYESSSINDKNTHRQFINFFSSYRKSYDEKGRRLAIRLTYNKNFMNSNENIQYSNSLLTQSKSANNNISENNNNSWRLSASFSNSINDKTEFAIENNFSYSGQTLRDNYLNFNSASGTFIQDPTNKIDYKQGILQNTLSGELKSTIFNFDVTFSLEYELYITNRDDKILDNSFCKRYSNLVPSLSIRKEITENQDLNLSCRRYYGYPQNMYLNPYTDYSDSTNIIVGNPDLEPYLQDSFNMSYTYYNSGLSISSGINYSKSKDRIESVITQYNMKTSITTYKNLSSFNCFGASINARGDKIFDFLDLSAWISYSASEYNGSNFNSKGSSWSSSLNTNASFKNLKFQLYFWYSSPSTKAQSKSNDQYSVDAGVKMLFYDRALTVTLKAKDLFNTLKKNSSSFGNGFTSFNISKVPTQIFSLNISYYFQSKANEDIEDIDRNRFETSDDF